MSIKSKWLKMKETVDAMEPDVNKFEDNSVKASGKRVRKGLQDVKKLAQELRKDIQAEING